MADFFIWCEQIEHSVLLDIIICDLKMNGANEKYLNKILRNVKRNNMVFFKAAATYLDGSNKLLYEFKNGEKG